MTAWLRNVACDHGDGKIPQRRVEGHPFEKQASSILIMDAKSRLEKRYAMHWQSDDAMHAECRSGTGLDKRGRNLRARGKP